MIALALPVRFPAPDPVAVVRSDTFAWTVGVRANPTIEIRKTVINPDRSLFWDILFNHGGRPIKILSLRVLFNRA